MDEHEIDEKKSAVPFTARIMAHYRAMESRNENPLIIDPFAERLAGGMNSYFEEHKRTRGTSDYAVVRTHYVDNHLLTPWCNAHDRSQIVLLGAGLDARAYRFKQLRENEHTVFEVDFDIVNSYKADILKDHKPFCGLVRVSTDVSEPTWISHLDKAGFSRDIPTFWILEGLVYYIEQDIVISMLKTAAKSCAEESQIFVDICVPGLTQAQFGPFMMHFKWGLNKEDVSQFFTHSGWNVTCTFADDYDQGRDVGQRGLMFVAGKRDLSKLDMPVTIITEDESAKISDSELKSFSTEFLGNLMVEIDLIVTSYMSNPDEGLVRYFRFIDRIKPSVQMILKSIPEPLSIGHVSSRLLRDPSTVVLHTQEEKEAHIVGYLKALMFLGFCGAKGVAGEQFPSTSIYSEGLKISKIDQLSSLAELIQGVIDNS